VDGELQPKDDFVSAVFKDIFTQCAAADSPQQWTDLPAGWQAKQQELLQRYDTTAPYKGVPGALPESMKLWPANKARLEAHKWPQYSIGAYPYCFRLPEYDPAKMKMGQAPGTHWYHAHKHGSTALNVGNGMTGAFIIEGAYDDALRTFYKETAAHKNWGLTEQVLVIQQLDSALNLFSPTNQLRPAPLSGQRTIESGHHDEAQPGAALADHQRRAPQLHRVRQLPRPWPAGTDGSVAADRAGRRAVRVQELRADRSRQRKIQHGHGEPRRPPHQGACVRGRLRAPGRDVSKRRAGWHADHAAHCAR